ncbi:hypothetical protein SJAG_02237 [Schizosaccharomyces japonicus yFS275]|uniref:Uncharacterized protein n=1 Tax=Schizosaccharomyces japonicus (strain yFS275 / FY16936) TaxID=402676 RepID=B6K1X4_SCHJY|nr:hypothetical protein SJAG_02237 [Schizosaccharomyces japonicus yFS275]EEB07155.2 hypothetical protein SJAG_02237 [Schizosaccharomyces japonicus yFS275]
METYFISLEDTKSQKSVLVTEFAGNEVTMNVLFHQATYCLHDDLQFRTLVRNRNGDSLSEKTIHDLLKGKQLGEYHLQAIPVNGSCNLYIIQSKPFPLRLASFQLQSVSETKSIFEWFWNCASSINKTIDKRIQRYAEEYEQLHQQLSALYETTKHREEQIVSTFSSMIKEALHKKELQETSVSAETTPAQQSPAVEAEVQDIDESETAPEHGDSSHSDTDPDAEETTSEE